MATESAVITDRIDAAYEEVLDLHFYDERKGVTAYLWCHSTHKKKLDFFAFLMSIIVPHVAEV